MTDHPQDAIDAATEALGVHRWKSMGTDSVECECGAILHGEARPFPADEAFRRHLAAALIDAALIDAAAPHLAAAERERPVVNVVVQVADGGVSDVIASAGGGRRDVDNDSCLCCDGTGWHVAECGAQVHCQSCDATGHTVRREP